MQIQGVIQIHGVIQIQGVIKMEWAFCIVCVSLFVCVDNKRGSRGDQQRSLSRLAECGSISLLKDTFSNQIVCVCNRFYLLGNLLNRSILRWQFVLQSFAPSAKAGSTSWLQRQAFLKQGFPARKTCLIWPCVMMTEKVLCTHSRTQSFERPFRWLLDVMYIDIYSLAELRKSSDPQKLGCAQLYNVHCTPNCDHRFQK